MGAFVGEFVQPVRSWFSTFQVKSVFSLCDPSPHDAAKARPYTVLVLSIHWGTERRTWHSPPFSQQQVSGDCHCPRLGPCTRGASGVGPPVGGGGLGALVGVLVGALVGGGLVGALVGAVLAVLA